MNWQQKKQLTKALLESSTSMGNRDTRQNIVDQLPLQIKVRIRRSDVDFNDVLSIISTCSVFSDGLLQLQEIVREFDGGTVHMTVIDHVFTDILSSHQRTTHEVSIALTKPAKATRSTEISASGEVLLNNRYQIFSVENINNGIESIALDKQRGTRVSLQLIPLRTMTTLPNFQETLQRLRQLSHPHLPNVIDYFVVEQGNYCAHYIVTEFVEGEILEEIIQKHNKPLSEREALGYISQICQAVQYLHKQVPPIIHRDITPQHIKIHGRRAVLTYLGAAAIFSQLSYAPNEQMRPIVNEGYTPIEQYERTADATIASDIYALGATLYRLVTNQAPPASKQRIMNEVVYTAPRRINREISRSLDEAITVALELDPPRRPPTITQWLQRFQNILYEKEMKYLEFCSQLETYLDAEKWQEADQETPKVIYTIINQQARGRPGRIADLPDIALDVINNLWERYSRGRYGFRIQLQIWREVARGDLQTFANSDFREFSHQVGWSVNNTELDYHQFTFTAEGAEGHLPSLKDQENTGPNSWMEWRSNVREILLRAENCLW